MSRINNRGRGFLGIANLCAIAFSANCASAQLKPIPDNSLGAESSVVIPNVNINGINSDRIDGGAIRGANLFHSFQEFNIEQGRGAYFTNPAGIENILSRVTGGNRSEIFGKLGVLGNANLFLINPNGIIFGRNASLDVRGSFVGTTANSLNFADGIKFSATAPQTTLLLSVNVPLGLQFGRNTGSIQNQSRATNSSRQTVGLQVQPSKTLALIGGDVKLDGGSLQAPGGRVELGGLFGAGTVEIDTDVASLRFPDNVARADVSLTNDAEVNVRAGGGGSIVINAQNLNLAGESKLRAGIASGNRTVNSKAGNIEINATEVIKLSDGSFIANVVQKGAAGNGGDINIQAESISSTDGSKIIATTFGRGNAGNVTINARDTVSFDEEKRQDSYYPSSHGGVYSRVETEGVGNGGNINVTTGSLSLTNGAVLTTSIYGQGDAGNVYINARDTVSLNGKGRLSKESSGAYSAVNSDAIGQGGNINVTANSLKLTNEAVLNTTVRGQGNAGNVTVRALDAISLERASINSSVQASGVGNGGNIDINAASLSLINGDRLLNSTTSGQGNAGNVTVRARDAVSLERASINTNVESGGIGKGGNIDINAATLSLIDSGQLQTSTSSASNNQPGGRGDAGNVNVNVTGAVDIAGSIGTSRSGIFSYVGTETVGNAGNITINSGSLSLRNGARLAAQTFAQGNAGNVTVRTLYAVSLVTNAGINGRIEALGEGKAGNININAASLSLIDGSQLQTAIGSASNNRPGGRGDAGDVNINVTGAVDIVGGILYPSGIFSYVGRGTVGNAGNITIDSGSLSLQNRAEVSTQTLAQGNAGTIKVNAAAKVTISGSSSNINTGLFVNSQTTTGTTGNIIVTSPRVTLNNNGRLNAQSRSGNGGNINLQTDLLLLRRGAQISTTAGTAQAGGNGGNINIDAPSGFIVAVKSENSDITANAFSGNGGQIKINATGIYGLENRSQLTPDPKISEINASSQSGINGTVEINTPEIDPNRGLVELPTVPLDTEVSQICQPRTAQNQSSFIIIGRGGLPPNPRTDLLTPDAVQVDWVTLKPSTQNRSNSSVSTKRTTATPEKIVEATGWVRNEKGEVVLTASAPTVTPHGSWQKPAFCSAIQSNK